MKKNEAKPEEQKNGSVTDIRDHKREKTIKRIIDRAKKSGHVQGGK